MSSTALRAVLNTLAAAGGLLGSLSVDAAPSPPQEEQAEPTRALYLQAFVNGVDKGLLIHVDQQAGRLYTSADELTEIGVDVAGLPLDADRRIALDAIEHLQYGYQPFAQRIDLTLPEAQLKPERVGYAPPPMQPPPSGTGLVLNYAARLQHNRLELDTPRRRQPAPLETYGYGPLPLMSSQAAAESYEEQNRTLVVGSDLRFFSPYGSIVNYGYSTLEHGRLEYVRQDSYWIYSSLDSLRTYTVGDFVSASLPWTRAMRMGGVRISRNFGLRPDLVTFPVPALGGTAVVPTMVDLYINGLRQFNGEASGGPFVIATPPALTGAGVATVVYRDALGREVVNTQSLYVDSRLLDAGLLDYSFELGYLRRRYGVRSFDYASTPAASASLRYGLNDALTLQGHTELGDGLRNAGVGALVGLGRFGVLNAAAAFSNGGGSGGDSDGGMQTNIGYQYISPRWSLHLQDLRTHGTYRDLGVVEGVSIPSRQARAMVSLAITPRQTLMLAYTRQQASSLGGSRIASLGYSNDITPRVALFANLFKDLDLHDSGGFSVGLSINLGQGLSLYGNTSRYGPERTASLNANKAVDADLGGFGWNVLADGGNHDYRHGAARLDYRGRYGDASAQIEHSTRPNANYTTTSLYATGALVFMDRTLLASRAIYDGFALVSTDGVPDVPVLHENRLIGQTDRQGHLLVPNLQSFQPNRLAIDTLNLPADANVETDRLVVTPRERSGVAARFPISRYRGATLILVDPQQRVLPPGTRATLRETGESALIGYDGHVFFPALQALNHLSAKVGDTACTAEVRFDAAAAMRTLGPFVCAPEGTP